MLNLLTILATVFTGFVVDFNGSTDAKFSMNYEFTVDDIDTVDSTAIQYAVELTPVLSISSVYFFDTFLESQALTPLLLEFEIADSLIRDVEYVSFNITYEEIFIDIFSSPISYIDFSFYYSFDFYWHYYDNTVSHDYVENYYNNVFYTNFTITDDISINDERFIYEFHYDFINDLGYDSGYDEGFSVGFDEGFDSGFADGYEQGSIDLSGVFNGSWVEWLGNAVTGFFALEIFPGFTLAGALGAVIAAYLMMWILKVLAGG